MAISYHIYANDGDGDDLDYSTPIATTSDLTFVTGYLKTPGVHIFAVRAFDASSGIEEANTDARVRIVLDADGNDVTAQPNAVVGLSARPTAGGTCWVSWGYDARGQGGPPLSFDVRLIVGSDPSIPNLAVPMDNPVARVAYLPGVSGYGCFISILPVGTPSTIAVQALGRSDGLQGPVATVPMTYLAPPLGEVESLMATPIA